MGNNELRTMILDHMERGFLENIIDMFKHDESLYPLIIDMIKDERVRVRLGATALVEELARFKQKPLVDIVPEIGLLLSDPNPTVRGDSANLLGIIRHANALPFLITIENDENDSVRQIVREAIQDIRLPAGA
jgi:HEAT repeat protein